MNFFTQKPPLYITLSQHTLWVGDSAKKRLRLNIEALSNEQILQHCLQWESSHWTVLLEFPWTFYRFDNILTLSTEEATHFSHNHLEYNSFNSVEKRKVGFSFLEHSPSKKTKILCALLSTQAQQFVFELKKATKAQVEVLPLIYACLPGILNNAQDHLIFKGLEDLQLIKTQEKQILTLTPLPPLSQEIFPHFIKDHLPAREQSFETICLDFENSAENTPCSIFNFLKTRKGEGRTPFQGFWWEQVEKKQKWNAKTGGVLAMTLLCLTVGGVYYSTQKNISSHKKELQSAKEQIEIGQNHITKLNEYTLKQNHFLRVNTLYEHLKASSLMARNLLEQVITPIKGVWIKKLYYEDERLDLKLLTLEPALISNVLTYLEGSPLIKTVHLREQQAITLREEKILELSLELQLKPVTLSKTSLQ
ncbi:hypothetical protein WDW89_11665 [Deltaproteobacteria bacterium TL4]